MNGLAIIPEISAELFVIPLDDDLAQDRYLVYAPLRKSAFIANAETVNFIADLQDGCCDPAQDGDGSLRHWLHWLGIVDSGNEPQPISSFDGSPLPVGVTLFLTTGCNLRCTYCYASAGDTPLRNMSIDVACQGIDYVSSNASLRGLSGFQIAFHGGGEPTLNWKVLTGAYDHAMNRADTLGLVCSASTATNGVISRNRVDWIIEHLDSASLSFDGDPLVHDSHRLTVKGQGSSHQVLRTIERFDASQFRYGIRVTATSDQIARLPRSIEFICRHAQPQTIQVEPAYQMGRWRNAPSAETVDFIARFREARAVARDFGHDLVYSAARAGLLTNHFCGVSQDTFALSPDGNVSSCYEVFSEDSAHAEEFFYGRPDDSGSYHFDLERLSRLRNQSVENKPFCDGCYAKWHCAGDCYHNALALHCSGEFAGTDRCHITRVLTRDQILENIMASGGVAWRG